MIWFCDDGDDDGGECDDDDDCDGFDDLMRPANPCKYNWDIIKSERGQKLSQFFNLLSAIIYQLNGKCLNYIYQTAQCDKKIPYHPILY